MARRLLGPHDTLSCVLITVDGNFEGYVLGSLTFLQKYLMKSSVHNTLKPTMIYFTDIRTARV